MLNVSVADELAQRTMVYWEISRIWCGQSKRSLPTDQAIHLCTDMMYDINPVRPLARRASVLREELIMGEGFEVIGEQKVLPFKRKA